MHIHNTKNWKYQRISKYSEVLTRAINKLVEKFPSEINPHQIAVEIAMGVQELWLILDKEEKFQAFLTTSISEDMQNNKKMELCQLSGEGGIDLTQFLPELEEYAIQNNVKTIYPIGRMGWQKALQNQGYRPVIFKYKKEIKNV